MKKTSYNAIEAYNKEMERLEKARKELVATQKRLEKLLSYDEEDATMEWSSSDPNCSKVVREFSEDSSEIRRDLSDLVVAIDEAEKRLHQALSSH